MERPRKERVVPRLCFDGSSLLRDSAVNNDIDLSELIFMRAHNGSNTTIDNTLTVHLICYIIILMIIE